MRKAAILVEKGVQDEEFIYPYYRLKEANFTVDVASTYPDTIYGKYGIPIHPTVLFRKLEEKNYDLVIVPGGWESPEKVRQNTDALNFLSDMYNAGKVIGAICHGPWVLISAKIVKGKKMTCYKGMKDDLENAGAKYVVEPVVTDKNIVTSPHYINNPEFLKEVLVAYESYLLANLVL